MKYKWASNKTNPAARYFPQTFSKEEEVLLYRCLNGAAESGKSEKTGVLLPVRWKSKARFMFRWSRTLYSKPLSVILKMSAAEVKAAIERNRGRKPTSAHKWLMKQGFDVSTFDDWWKKTARLSLEQRIAAVDVMRETNISKKSYAKPVKSVIIGFYGRDSQNPWGRITGPKNVKSKDYSPHHFQKVLPLIRRINEAFKLALPERYEAQKRFCDRLDPRFVIEGTCFTTITVNKNFRTYAHRDPGDLSQGFSNLAVFSNGREFKGGHLVLPEFNVEFALAPRDLLFIANHEYIHENTAIEAIDPESERISIVCYAREDLAFCGTVEYEALRRQFTLECDRLFPRMWESTRWYNYLMRELGYPTASLIEKARLHNFLNPEILTLAAKFGGEPWREKWELPRNNAGAAFQTAASTAGIDIGYPFQNSRQTSGRIKMVL